MAAAALLIVAAVAFAWPMWRKRQFDARPFAIWLLQTATVAMLLVMLWQPALSVATFRPQQNIVAVVVDDSRSMATLDNGVSRRGNSLKASTLSKI